MGDVSDMMLDGTLCEACGVYLGGTEFDVPLLCDSCAKERRRYGCDVQRAGKFWQDCGERNKRALLEVKVKCPECSKLVKLAGLKDHARVVHGTAP